MDLVLEDGLFSKHLLEFRFQSYLRWIWYWKYPLQLLGLSSGPVSILFEVDLVLEVLWVRETWMYDPKFQSYLRWIWYWKSWTVFQTSARISVSILFEVDLVLEEPSP